MATIVANGTVLYHEVRGSGPPLLLVSGASGDAGHWTEVAEKLSDAFTVVTYDRRGNSRSPEAADWTETSLAEQAEDAAALLRGLGLAPATVVGSSFGAIIACELVSRHGDVVVSRAVLHEPPLLGVVPDGDRLGAELAALIEAGLSAGGPATAMESFLRLVYTDVVFDALEPRTRKRMLGNAEVFLGIELPHVAAYRPDLALLRASGVPIVPAVGVDNRGTYLDQIGRWLAEGLGVEPVEISGAHVPYFDRPATFADEIRSLLDTM